jgi:hypothetical protein
MNKKMFSSDSVGLFIMLSILVAILGGDRAVVFRDVVVVPFAPGLRGLRLFAMMLD